MNKDKLKALRKQLQALRVELQTETDSLAKTPDRMHLQQEMLNHIFAAQHLIHVFWGVAENNDHNSLVTENNAIANYKG